MDIKKTEDGKEKLKKQKKRKEKFLKEKKIVVVFSKIALCIFSYTPPPPYMSIKKEIA